MCLSLCSNSLHFSWLVRVSRAIWPQIHQFFILEFIPQCINPFRHPLFTHPSINTSICSLMHSFILPPTYPSTISPSHPQPFVHPPVHLSFPTYLCTLLPTDLSTYPFFHPPTNRPTKLPIHPLLPSQPIIKPHIHSSFYPSNHHIQSLCPFRRYLIPPVEKTSR